MTDNLKDRLRDWFNSKAKEDKGMTQENFEKIYQYIVNPKPKWVGLIDDRKPFSNIAEDIEFEML